jgi:hypothetical protein
MHHYELRYEAPDPQQVKSLSFDAHTFAGALDIAKKQARGEWAELHEDGRPVCRLELVENTGVWLIGGPRHAEPAADSEAGRQGIPEECRASLGSSATAMDRAGPGNGSASRPA